jgi:hypothetical protein
MRHTTLTLALYLAAIPVAGSSQAPKAIDPAGTYAVTTLSDTGQAMTGTLTIAAGANGSYSGQFVSPTVAAPVPVVSVAANGGEVVIILRPSPRDLALVWVERGADGAFKGTWHQLGAGINATLIKK